MSFQKTICLLFAASLSSCISSSGAADPELIQAPRTVVVGDVHGDAPQFERLLQAAELIDEDGQWIGADTHLIQMGDLTDRGPTSKRAIELLERLSIEADEAGGQVSVIIGNHDMMNVLGDLRYVHPGEYEAFVSRSSRKLRNNYYKQVKDHEKKTAQLNGERIKFDRAHRQAFDNRIPLGYVEHRLAWAPIGKFGKWAISLPSVIVNNGVLYAHAGVSNAYQDMSAEKINTLVRTALIENSNADDILYDEEGPLWFRGWAVWPETLENEARLDQVLDSFGASRMVIAHTPLSATVIPRFNAKVLLVDVGMAEYYGSGDGVLEFHGDDAFVRHGETLIKIPERDESRLEYLQAVSAVAANPKRVLAYKAKIEASGSDKTQNELPQDDQKSAVN